MSSVTPPCDLECASCRYQLDPTHCADVVSGAVAVGENELDGLRAENARLRRECIEQEAASLELAGDLEIVQKKLDGARAGANRFRDHLSTIVDEAFGLQEVLGTDALLSRLESLLNAQIGRHQGALRERDAARSRISALEKVALDAASQCDHCDPAVDIECLSQALRNLINSVTATKTRDTIVLRDIGDALKVLREGRS